jgi:nucleoside-diphosphate-sugar epimerase
MGGIGYISASLAPIARNNILINTHMLEAARVNKVRKFLFSSSACVYPGFKQDNALIAPLAEEDAFPADPERGYGWEKLFAEQLCMYYHLDYEMEIRIARCHNVYGPLGTYDGGKEKAPAAFCRKIALATDGGEIEIWGDGEQTRSFLFIDDCIDGMVRLMTSDYCDPVNIGTDILMSINRLADLISEIAGKKIVKRYNLSKPQGVRGRNADLSRARNILNWFPITTVEDGLSKTYRWIRSEIERTSSSRGASPAT